MTFHGEPRADHDTMHHVHESPPVMTIPLGVLAAALFIAAIFVGADSMSRAMGVSSYIANLIVATSLLTMLLARLLAGYRIRPGYRIRH